MKVCVVCKKEKPDKDFININLKELKTCVTCVSLNKRWREKNKDILKERRKMLYEVNKETEREKRRQWREANKGRNRDIQKKWHTAPAKYSTYKDKLTVLESPVEDKNGNLLVRCTKCKRYFIPKNQDVQHRVKALNMSTGKENRLYCSDECKNSCEVFRKIKDPAERAANFERDPTWSKNVKERANYTCERCGSKEKLEAHHEIAVKVDSTKANDLDNGICLCHECHVKAHSESGCTLSDLRKHNATNPQS